MSSPGEGTAPTPSGSSSSPKRIVYQAETTGSYWGDVKEAVKRLSTDDVKKVNEIPCARNSLLTGIASGVGVGVVRGMSASVFVASNWAVASFCFISLGAWTICQRNLLEERRRVQQIVEQVPRRYIKKDEGEGTK